MSAQNDFLPFATAAGANVLTQSAYAALGSRASGFAAGVAQSAALNKAWRQSSIISAAVAQLIADTAGANVIDDGTTATIEASLAAAIRLLGAQAAFALRPYGDNSTAGASTAYVDRAAAQSGGYVADTGPTVNQYVVAVTSAAGDLTHPVVFCFRAARTNTGAATLDFGLGPVPLVNSANAALVANDILAGALVDVVYDPTVAKAVVGGVLKSQIIGQGLEDDGTGAARVKLADNSVRRSASGVQASSPVYAVAANTAITTQHNCAVLVGLGAYTLTAPKASTLWNGFVTTVSAVGGNVTFAPNAADLVNGGGAGVPFTIIQGQSIEFVCNGVDGWWPISQTTPQGTYSPRFLGTSQVLGAGTYAIDTSAGSITISLLSGVAAGTTLEFSDVSGSWARNPLIVSPNGSTIQGLAENLVCDVSGETFKIWYNGSDWRLF